MAPLDFIGQNLEYMYVHVLQIDQETFPGLLQVTRSSWEFQGGTEVDHLGKK